jgi:uncharacterized caspase-like protein
MRRLALPALLLAALAALARPADDEGRRYALLVGVNKYDHDKLKDLQFAEADAAKTAELLKGYGYEVVLLTTEVGKADPSRRPTLANVQAKLTELVNRCTKRDLLLVGVAGHGLQFGGTRDAFFCPQDAKPFPDRLDTLLSLTQVYDQLDRSGAGVKLLLVDACRDDPQQGRGRGVDGNTAPRPPAGVAALFSCSAGERAFEHEKLGHGVFFHRVLKGLEGEAKNARGDVTWDGLQTYVRDEVTDEVPKLIGGGARQTPSLNAGELRGKSPVLARPKAAVVTANAPDLDGRKFVHFGPDGPRVLVSVVPNSGFMVVCP